MLVLCFSLARAADDPPEGVVAGVTIGPDIAIQALGVGVLPRLELGYAKVAGPVRVEPFVSGSWTRLSVEGSGTDAAVGGPYTWHLRQDALSLGVGLGVELKAPIAKIVRPELAIGPTVTFFDARGTGGTDGSEFGETRETYARGGLYAALNAAIVLGPGELTIGAQLAAAGLVGTLAGEAPATTITPAIGYRLVL